VAVVVGMGGATAGTRRGWPYYVRNAERYARSRRGSIAFAVVGSGGRMHGYQTQLEMPSASVVKVVLLVTYLRMRSVRDRDLRDSDRSLLAPMIKRSDSSAATRVANIVGATRIERLARKAKMHRFHYRRPWGFTRITAGEMARFMDRIQRFIPVRHRDYARYLLSHVVDPQRWGLASFVDDRLPLWHLYFKGGWGSGTGWVDHQVAYMQLHGDRVAVAVLTHNDPSHGYGIETLRGIGRLLLDHLRHR
jgi:beta-lactamase family protein